MNQLSPHQEWLAKQIVDIAFHIHYALGPGLLESVYQHCFKIELIERNIHFRSEELVSIYYNNHEIKNALKIDLLIDDLIIVELKAQDNYHPVWEAQLLSYLKLSDKQLGFIINFHVPLIKDGIKRMIARPKLSET